MTEPTEPTQPTQPSRPAEPAEPAAPWAPAPPPPHVRWRRHVAAVSAIVAVVGAALVCAVLITLMSVPAPLPVPRTLPRDPVPAERIRWSIPPDCGISAATRKALVPDATVEAAGDGGGCRWYVEKAAFGDRSLEVSVTAHHAGPGVPGAADNGDSSTAAAISALSVGGAYQGATNTPLTGLGDEAILSETPSGDSPDADVEFRTGNVTVRAEYGVAFVPVKGRARLTGRLRAGALRAAADVARALGAPAAPKAGAAPARAPAVHTPASACAVVPSDLRDRLLGTEDRDAEPGEDQEDDPYAGGSLLRGARDQTCDLHSDSRKIIVAITTSTAPTATRDAGREYLRRYLDARAEKPIAGTDARYFHALSGLGDQAFCAYLAESSSVNGPESPARVVIRVGPALVSVLYGTVTDDYADADPLTRDEAVDGAYAVAVKVAAGVK